MKTALLKERFSEAWNRKNGSATADRERLEARLQDIQKRKRRLLSMMQDELISEGDFKEQYGPLNAQISEIEAALIAVPEELSRDTAYSYLGHLLMNLHILWNQSDEVEKRRFGRLVFPAGVTCSKRVLEHL